MIYRGLAITGTDTGAGKTAVAGALASLFREAGLKVGALKPVETGCEHGRPADGLILARAAGLFIKELSDGPASETIELDDVVPWRLTAPLAPEMAAKLEGLELGVDRIFQAMDRWMERADLVIVETAGGIMVPLNPCFTFLDLIQGLELPVIIAAQNRLGVINHALLTLEALKNRDLTPIAVVMNNLSPEPDPSAKTNAAMIEQRTGVPVYEVPFCDLSKDDEDSGSGLIEHTARALGPRLSEIRAAMEKEWARVAARYVGQDRKDHGGRK